MARPTLRMLARDLNLSVTTVSRALTGYSDVADDTRIRVIEAAKLAGYVPNSAGKSLVTGRTGFVGMLMPLSDQPQIDPFFSEFLAGLGEGLLTRNRDLILATVGPRQREIDVLKRVVEGGRADGVVLTRIAERDERVDYLKERNFPFMTHGRTRDSTKHKSNCWVDTDGGKAFSHAFKLLYELGHRHFALLSIDEPMSFRHFREQGLQNAIDQHHDAEITLTRTSMPRFNTQIRAARARDVLSATTRPTAIVALTDEIALSVLEQATILGIKVPEQLSVIGFDNLPASAWSTPALSTFNQEVRATAFMLAEKLIERIDGNPDQYNDGQGHLMDAQFIARASHGKAPVSIGRRKTRQYSCSPNP